MARVRVPLFRSTKSVIVDTSASAGALLGVNLYYNGVLLDPRLILNSYAAPSVPGQGGGDLTTDNVYEGSRLYFTAQRAQDAVGGILADSDDVTLDYASGAITADLTPTGVPAGTYGDAANIPQITIDENGRVTSVTLIPVGLRSDFAILTEAGNYLTTEANDHILGSQYG